MGKAFKGSREEGEDDGRGGHNNTWEHISYLRNAQEREKTGKKP